ncbi:MAG: hypothetical protein U0X75_09780 [Acidobacteriota bacterium]
MATADGQKSILALTVDVTYEALRVVAAARSDARRLRLAAKLNMLRWRQSFDRRAKRSALRASFDRWQERRSERGRDRALIIAGVGGAVAGIVAASQSDNVTPSSIVVSGFRP